MRECASWKELMEYQLAVRRGEGDGRRGKQRDKERGE